MMMLSFAKKKFCYIFVNHKFFNNGIINRYITVAGEKQRAILFNLLLSKILIFRLIKFQIVR